MAAGDFLDDLFIVEGVFHEYPPSSFRTLDPDLLRAQIYPTSEISNIVSVLKKPQDEANTYVDQRAGVRQVFEATWADSAFMDVCMRDHLTLLYELQKPIWLQYDSEMSRFCARLERADDDNIGYFTPTFPIKPLGWNPKDDIDWTDCLIVNENFVNTGFTVDETSGMIRFDSAQFDDATIALAYTWRTYVRIAALNLTPVPGVFLDHRRAYLGTVVFEQLTVPATYTDSWDKKLPCAPCLNEVSEGDGGSGGGIDPYDEPFNCKCKKQTDIFAGDIDVISTLGDPQFYRITWSQESAPLPADMFVDKIVIGGTLLDTSGNCPCRPNQEQITWAIQLAVNSVTIGPTKTFNNLKFGSVSQEGDLSYWFGSTMWQSMDPRDPNKWWKPGKFTMDARMTGMFCFYETDGSGAMYTIKKRADTVVHADGADNQTAEFHQTCGTGECGGPFFPLWPGVSIAPFGACSIYYHPQDLPRPLNVSISGEVGHEHFWNRLGTVVPPLFRKYRVHLSAGGANNYVDIQSQAFDPPTPRDIVVTVGLDETGYGKIMWPASASVSATCKTGNAFEDSWLNYGLGAGALTGPIRDTTPVYTPEVTLISRKLCKAQDVAMEVYDNGVLQGAGGTNGTLLSLPINHLGASTHAIDFKNFPLMSEIASSGHSAEPVTGGILSFKARVVGLANKAAVVSITKNADTPGVTFVYNANLTSAWQDFNLGYYYDANFFHWFTSVAQLNNIKLRVEVNKDNLIDYTIEISDLKALFYFPPGGC